MSPRLGPLDACLPGGWGGVPSLPLPRMDPRCVRQPCDGWRLQMVRLGSGGETQL